jgi:uncharacterized damage-inducible protein DinB
MKQVNWFERDFAFKPAQNIFPAILERLMGTPVRLEEKLKTIPTDVATIRLDGTWTVKENVGHLLDLEPLWQGRLDDILTGKTDLRPTDLQNSKTSLANHNATPTDELLYSFRRARKYTVSLLEELREEDIFRSARHPRLKTPMRTLDLFLFVAEHDDHHLARITELTKFANQAK